MKHIFNKALITEIKNIVLIPTPLSSRRGVWGEVWLILLFLVLFAGCSETDNYYAQLKKQPELVKDYDAVYAVNDTLTIKGHFIANGLQIKIGDAAANIISISNKLNNATYNDSIQVVKLIVTNAMGVGTARPVSITSSGITVSGPAIEIVENSKAGLLPNGLTVQKIADYPTNSTPVYCRSGNGNLYFINKTTNTVTRMMPDGTLTQVFGPSQCKDADGTLFTVTRLNGCGIDPHEQYLYLSLYTVAPSRTYYHYYRLCRWDMVNKTFTVLNKTPYYIYKSKRTLSDAQPFEGTIQQVKMFTATGIYPDSVGNVYFDMDNRMITRLDAAGNYSYVLKNSYTNYTLTDPAPQIVNPATSDYYSLSRTLQFFPGVIANYTKIEAIAPDENFLYVRQTTARLVRYDLTNQVMLNTFNKWLDASNFKKPYISGSFDVLTGATNDKNSLWGMMPLSDGKLLILYYQDLIADNEQTKAFYGKFDLPAWGILDFINERGSRYAPGGFDRQGYVMNYGTDALLNRDAQGMLYMTANNKSVILKTIYK